MPEEPWVKQVTFVKADAALEGSVKEALEAAKPDGVVSCMGAGDILRISDDGWEGRWAWSETSQKMYDENFTPNSYAVEAAKAAGATRFVYVGTSTDAQQGYAGPNPGLYTGKLDAAIAARDAFGDGFTSFGPHCVVESDKDVRIKATTSGLGRGLMWVLTSSWRALALAGTF